MPIETVLIQTIPYWEGTSIGLQDDDPRGTRRGLELRDELCYHLVGEYQLGQVSFTQDLPELLWRPLPILYQWFRDKVAGPIEDKGIMWQQEVSEEERGARDVPDLRNGLKLRPLSDNASSQAGHSSQTRRQTYRDCVGQDWTHDGPY